MKVVKKSPKLFIERILLIVVFMIPFLFMSCDKIIYRYNGKNYDSSEEALDAQKRDIDLILSNISATKNPVGGSAIVILPSNYYAIKNFVHYRHDIEIGKEYIVKLNNYFIKFFTNKVYMYANAIKKREIFNFVTFIDSDDPEKAVFSEDIAVILKSEGGKPKWFLKEKNDHSPGMIGIELASWDIPIEIWLNSIEKAARK